MASSNAYGPPAGYACGILWDNWYSCCPEGTLCRDINTCCPSNADCTPVIEQDPHCANNNTAYGRIQGLNYNGTRTEGAGCSNTLPDGDMQTTALPPVARLRAAQSSMSSSMPTPFPTNILADSPSSKPSPLDAESSSSTNSGAIAGGVSDLALILALVWYPMRRRQKAARSSLLASTSGSAPGHDTTAQAGLFPAELDHNPYRAELSENHDGLPHELPGEGGR
ncbi:hypothetical protein BDW72DRAFT_210484 [Aspergillus terricola var. indicus]